MIFARLRIKLPYFISADGTLNAMNDTTSEVAVVPEFECKHLETICTRCVVEWSWDHDFEGFVNKDGA